MKKVTCLLIALLSLGFSGGLFAADEGNTASDYLYNGITYMSMQADDGEWMDTVWALEVESASNNLFDLVVSPTPKRISIKALTDFKSDEWIQVWNRKLRALDMSSGLEQGEYAKSFAAVMQYLPEQLNANDQFSIESISRSEIKLSINGEELATFEADSQFSFWMSAWMSAPNAGIYADGNMLAQGNIDSYLLELLEDEVPSLDPSMIVSAY